MQTKTLPDTTRITWLASYPKSGNTWTRTFLTNYLRESPEEADINNLYGGPIACSRLLFDHAVGMASASMLPAETASLRPQVYRHFTATSDRPGFFKVHDAWSVTPLGEPLFPADATHCVVYIVRNPLDVAVSAAHHFGHSIGRAVNNLCDANFSLATFKTDTAAAQLPQHLGTWSHHVQSWVQESQLRVHLVRYEDMLQNPKREFATILRFIGIDVDEQRLSEAVEISSFANLQRQEAEGGFRERRLDATAPFFRKGIAGGWRDELEDSLVQKLIRAHRKTMCELKYLDEGGTLYC